MNRIIEYILDLIYPPRCAFCRKVIAPDKSGVCAECLKKLPLLKPSEQRKMLDGGFVCYFPLLYDQMVRDSFLRYKFYGNVSYAGTYSAFLAECIKATGQRFDFVTWVPLSAKKRKKRGYDQAQLLAEGVSGLLGLDCEKILYKNKETKTQSLTKDRNERKKNVKNAFSLCKGLDVNGKSILVIDDIVTTGATLSECCTVLKKAGAELVVAAALASAAG